MSKYYRSDRGSRQEIRFRESDPNVEPLEGELFINDDKLVVRLDGENHIVAPPEAAGTQGPQGNQGPTGPQGSTGSTGTQGAKGDPGVQGAMGYQGPQGFTGQQGSTGLQGMTGSQGPQGDTGTQGTTGAQGVQGPQGSTSTNEIFLSSGTNETNNTSTLSSSTELNTGANVLLNNTRYYINLILYIRAYSADDFKFTLGGDLIGLTDSCIVRYKPTSSSVMNSQLVEFNGGTSVITQAVNNNPESQIIQVEGIIMTGANASTFGVYVRWAKISNTNASLFAEITRGSNMLLKRLD